MIRLLLLAILLTVGQLAFAQISATTETGSKVLLFEDGTWKYVEKDGDKVSQSISGTVDKIKSKVAVDSTREFETPAEELIYMPSPRLARYFGEAKSNVRCKLSCSNNRGNVRVHYQWDIPNGEAHRYFGYFKAESKITIHLLTGQIVELLVGDDSQVKAVGKYNFTTISGASQALTAEQIVALTSQPMIKIEVEWKKNPELYDVKNTNYFTNTLPLVF